MLIWTLTDSEAYRTMVYQLNVKTKKRKTLILPCTSSYIVETSVETTQFGKAASL